MSDRKLFMILLGCTPPGRHVEQHDFFFGVAPLLKDLVPEIKSFWPEAGKIHIDGWREVNIVEQFEIRVVMKNELLQETRENTNHLFFINLGGYQRNVFSEQHHVLLTVQPDQASAIQTAKSTSFFKQNHFDKATSHIDDKYAFDVDEIYPVNDILPARQKELFRIQLIPAADKKDDEINLGYLKLNSL